VPATLFCLLFISALGATAVVPCYLLGAVDGNRRTGLLAAGLLAITPNTVFYYLSLDVVLMALAAWALAGVVYAVRGGRLAVWPAFGAGLALGIAGLLSLGAAAPALLALGYLALAAGTGRVTWRHAALAAALVVAGVVVVLGTATVLGLQTVTVYRTACGFTRPAAAASATVSTWPWLPFNVIDYAVFLGLPLVLVITEAAARRDLAGRPRRCCWPRRWARCWC